MNIFAKIRVFDAVETRVWKKPCGSFFRVCVVAAFVERMTSEWGRGLFVGVQCRVEIDLQWGKRFFFCSSGEREKKKTKCYRMCAQLSSVDMWREKVIWAGGTLSWTGWWSGKGRFSVLSKIGVSEENCKDGMGVEKEVKK